MRFSDNTGILYADDDEIDIECMRRSFARVGIANPLHIARNGLEALEMLQGEGRLPPQPSIALLDINMPCMSGLEALKKIRDDPRTRRLQVFMLSTSDHHIDLNRAYDLGIAGYLVKPPNSASLAETGAKLRAVWRTTEYPPPLRVAA